MKYLDEYRDEAPIRRTAQEIKRIASRRWRVMEVCGGQTHSILRNGIHQLLEGSVEFLHGPGCPVCVTPISFIDRAIAIAGQPGVTLCSYGDMLRVPGSRESLLSARAGGADVRTVYSPLDALLLAQRQPDRKVVFFAVGFETTAPANAMAVLQARRLGISNFLVLSAMVLVPPAIRALLATPEVGVDGFLGPGHVCSVAGSSDYEAIAQDFRVPFVITGFEPLDLMEGVLRLVRQLEAGETCVVNQYSRSVRAAGNLRARQAMNEVLVPEDREWRGIGVIPGSGLTVSPEYRAHDALAAYGMGLPAAEEGNGCIAGLILQGLRKPADCPAFGKNCSPEHPMGATMVSSEGACAAYFAYPSVSPDSLQEVRS
ncbi:MAG: hydrogenase formation protein HypD [Armatimonadetes bacterium]|nr:hydrogenase formation protein HypD [Armatimonadota bacterium]